MHHDTLRCPGCVNKEMEIVHLSKENMTLRQEMGRLDDDGFDVLLRVVRERDEAEADLQCANVKLEEALARVEDFHRYNDELKGIARECAARVVDVEKLLAESNRWRRANRINYEECYDERESAWAENERLRNALNEALATIEAYPEDAKA